MTSDLTIYALVVVVGTMLGFALARLLPRQAPAEREDLLAEARNASEDRVRGARGRALEERAEAEAWARHALTATEEVEHRLSRREERLEGRLDSLTGREAAAEQREARQAERAAGVDRAHEEELAALERIRALPPAVARAQLLEEVAPHAREASLARAEAILAESAALCHEVRARPTALAAQRSSSELVGEFALVPVPIPREEIKGRIIGREGRNIKAFEATTGVELVIDDAPDVVTLSGFDPIRREVARLALLDLVEDGRIHPGRIEEAVKRVRETLSGRLREEGAHAAEAAGVGHLAPDLVDLLGRLRLIRNGTEDALQEAVRLASVAAAFASELKADERVVRRAALLRDVSRAVGREAGGSTDAITADVLTRVGESPAVVATVRTPGELYPAVTPEQAAVWLASAFVEAGRGVLDESPIRRVDAIEGAATLVEGVADALAFQVGTRVRLLLRPTQGPDTVARVLLARAVLERIEGSLGPKVGLTIALLVPQTRRRGQGDGGNSPAGRTGGPRVSPGADVSGPRRGDGSGLGNGAARLEGGRPPSRGRPGRRPE